MGVVAVFLEDVYLKHKHYQVGMEVPVVVQQQLIVTIQIIFLELVSEEPQAVVMVVMEWSL